MIALSVFALLAIQYHAGPAAKQSDAASARRFVQNFYDWYIGMENRRDKQLERLGGDAFHKRHPDAEDFDSTIAINAKPALFSSELRRALLKEQAAQDKDSEFIEGLDFDPFVNAQDIPIHSRVTKVVPKGKLWLVYVKCTYDNTNATSSLVAELEENRANHSWRFTNFLYTDAPHPDNLLHMLKQ